MQQNRLFSYIGSKILIRSGLAILQTLLIVLAIILGFDSPEPNLIFWPIGLASANFLTLLTSISLGLMLSAFVKSESEANSALPLVIIPQIIFSGVLFELEGFSSKLSWLMPSRWSVGAYGALVNVNAMIPPPTQLPDGTTLTQLVTATEIYDSTLTNLSLNWGILCLHIVVYLATAFWLQKRKDIL